MGEGSSNEEILLIKLRKSCAVAFTRMEERDGGGGRVIEEIFHLVDGLQCHFVVGDLLGSIETDGWRRSAKRAVHFFVGDPAIPRESMTIHGGFLLKQRDLTEIKLRNSIKKLMAEGRHASSLKKPSIQSQYGTSLDEILNESSYVVVCDTFNEDGYERTYAREVIKVSENSIHPPDVGQEIGVKRKIGPNESFQSGGALAFLDLEFGAPSHIVKISQGRLSLFGGMRIEYVLKKIQAVSRSPGNSESEGK